MRFRAYRDADYEAVCDFLTELNRSKQYHLNWVWARFEWMYEHPEFDKTARERFGLWWEDGRIVGAAIYDMYYGEAFCGALPGYEALYPTILAYAWEALRDENGLGVSIRDGCAPEIEAALAAGFAPAEQTETVLRLELDRLPARSLPAGLRLAELDHEADGRALSWLAWQGFDHGDDRAEWERSDPGVYKNRPHFDKRLSLGALDENGETVSGCCLWYRPGDNYAYVEPVCTIPAWRGKGAAGALLCEAARRARDLGAKRAYVISDQTFYKRLGFVEDCHFTFYWRKP